MIVADGLTKRFDGFTAVDGVSLTVAHGALLALLGPNGAGKTTTVRMLSAILQPTEGRASINGYDVVTEAEVDEFLQLIPHARYVDVDRARHMVAGDRNDIFSAAVVEFLDGLRNELP